MRTQIRTAAAMTIETLEERRLMTFVPTDMVDLAYHYPTKLGQTRLYLNFDGGAVNNFQSGNKLRTVEPYVPPAGVDRAKAIQDIVYRTAQIFSPFNVRVMVKTGAGTFGTEAGASTIFVGDSPDNVKNGVNITRAFVASNSSDHPGDIKGYGHKPNGDNFDLGFVDPVFAPAPGQPLVTRAARDVARSVAHEAGHTFGLVHVLSSPADDVMSYNSANSAFLNQSFDVTDLNNGPNGVVPESHVLAKVNATDASGKTFVHTIWKQNSFAYLRRALGAKEVTIDSYYRSVADKTTISSDYYDVLGAPTVITPASHPSALLSTFGEYDAYTLTNPVSAAQANVAPSPWRISLTVGNANGGSMFNPQILLYSNDGSQLLAASSSSSLVYTLGNNASYKLVISGHLGATAGAYTVNMSRVSPPASKGTPTLGLATITPLAAPAPQPVAVFSNTLLKSDTSLFA